MANKFSKKMHRKMRNVLAKIFFDERILLKNIFEYCQNDMLMKQGVCFEQDSRYQYYRKIHELITIKKLTDQNVSLLRVGKSDDGGYIMAKGESGFSSEKVAYSVGICDDVSWDMEMAKEGYQIFQYDHTIKKLPEKHKNFHWKKIGLTGEQETKELKKLKTLMRDNQHDDLNGALLKMDIEGFEWGVFKNCDADTLGRFDQILLELHNFHNMNNREKIIAALENLNKTHQAIHVHANNMSAVEYCGDIIMPNCIEVIYLNKNKYHFADSDMCFPTELDKPNLSRIPDIKLGKWNL